VKKVQKRGLESIKTSKIIIPFYKNSLTDAAKKRLEDKARSYNNDPNDPFIFCNLYELNKEVKSDDPDFTPITWCDVLKHHLPKWVIIKTNGLYENLTRERVNLLIAEFFKYMPFVQQRLWTALKIPFGAGFDKELEANDYKKNDYARCRLKEQLKFEVIDKLLDVEIIDIG